MKYKLMIIILLSLFFLVCKNKSSEAASTNTYSSDIFVGSHHADKICIDMDSIKIHQLYDSTMIKIETYFGPMSGILEAHIYISFDAENRMDIVLDSSKVYSIRVWGTRFITEDGIRIGENYLILKNKYEKYRILEGEELGPPYFVLDNGISFELTQNSKWMNRSFENEDLKKYVDDNLKISSILVWK